MAAGRSADDSAVLGDAVTSLCERVGLTAADLDVNELTDEMHGFGIARRISLCGALEILLPLQTPEGSRRRAQPRCDQAASGGAK